MRYYKTIHGYNEADYLPITQDELPKAIALFIEGKGRGLFTSGAIRGQDIMRIVPDWHTDQGWNKGWKMTASDFEAIKPLERGYQDFYAKAKLVAEMALRENRPELLSKPPEEILAITTKSGAMEETKQLADKLRI